MSHTASPTKEPYRPSKKELDMLEHYQLDLSKHCPRTKYGFPGVPCPSESIMTQLELKRHALRNTLDHCSERELSIKAELDRQELEKQKSLQRVAVEVRDNRKDSVASMDPPKAAQPRDMGNVYIPKDSAIYDSDEDNEDDSEDEDDYEDEDEDEEEKEEECYDEDPPADLAIPDNQKQIPTSTSTSVSV